MLGVIRKPYFQIIVVINLFLSVHAKIIHVGPKEMNKKPGDAARIATQGDTINIEAGVYVNDVAVWRSNNLTIRGINGKAHLESRGAHAEGKAIWVIKGNNTIVENIEFSGAAVPDGNGAGIRQEGVGLTIRNCYFHENENGILTGQNPASDILIENTEFDSNGSGDGLTHNIYIGRVKSFTLKFCYVHHAVIGHNVKSRAASNFILYNRIMDEETGTSSFDIDLPNGGKSYIIGNLIQQGPETDNFHIISVGAERLIDDKNDLFIVNNTIVNDKQDGIFIKVVDGISPIKICNNIFAGSGTVFTGSEEIKDNLFFPDIHKTFAIFSKNPKLVDISNYDYRLTKNSPAIDAGINAGTVNGFSLVPEWQYVHPLKAERRIIEGSIDVGAYEFNDK